MRTLDVAGKDISQLLRDWRSAAFLVAAPILFTVLMGVMMGGLNKPSEEDPRLPVAILDRDGGILADSLVKLIDNSDLLRPVRVEEKDAESLAAQVSEGKFAAAIIIPAGYTREMMNGRDNPFQWVVDPGSESGSSADRALQSLMFRLMTAVQTARWSAELVAEQKGFDSASDRESFFAETVQAALEGWQAAPATLELRSAASASPQAQSIPSGFAQSSPGNMVTFALAGLIGAAEIVVWERKSGTLQRLMTTSISRLEVLIGHFLAMFLMVFLQVILLGTFGQLIFGLAYWRDPAAFLIMSTAVTLWIAAMGLLIGVIARSSDQIAMLSIAPMLVLAGLGGAWMPLEVTGETFQAVGHLTPTYWAMLGMQNLILHGQGFSGIILPAIVLCGFGVAFFGIAVWRFQTE